MTASARGTCVFLGFVLLFSTFNQSCKKFEKPGYMPKAGVALTFDDFGVDNWYTYLDFFDSMQIKATFYVSNYNLLNASQKEKLHKIEDRGHEIAFHSLNHVNFLKYIQKNTPSKLMELEVDKGMAMMNKDGFYPKTFAYPFGSHNSGLDDLLLSRFKSVRALNGSTNYAKSYTSDTNNQVLYGIDIDESSKKTMPEILNLIDVAKNNDNCLVLVIHHIQKTNTTLQIPLEKLRQVVNKVNSLDMKFYTVSEVSSK